MPYQVYIKFGPHEWTFAQTPYVHVSEAELFFPDEDPPPATSTTLTIPHGMGEDPVFGPDNIGDPITGDGIPADTVIVSTTDHDTYEEVEVSNPIPGVPATLIAITVKTKRRRSVADGIYVLSGLDFGWDSQPGLFLRQPNPMTASFSVTLPDFTELEASISSQVAIEVKADVEGDVIGRFYGDVTDLQAVTRRGRTGVTLSVVAVDYTVRLAELQPVLPFILAEAPYFTEGGVTEKDSARGIWNNAPISGDPGAVWSSPDTRKMGTAAIPSTIEAELLVKPREWLTALLDQAVNRTGLVDESSRMVVAPVVVDGELAVVSDEPTFTLDTVVVGILSEYFPDLELPSSAVRRNLSWRADKGAAPDYVTVAGTPETRDIPDFNFSESYTLGMNGSGTGTGQTITGHFYLEAEAADTASFYAIHPLPRWQLDPLTIPVSRGDLAASIPANLFPDWTLTEGDPDRGICYSTVVWINDVPTDQLPGIDVWAVDPGTLKGWLVGARCRVAGGELEIDITIRQQAEEPE